MTGCLQPHDYGLLRACEQRRCRYVSHAGSARRADLQQQAARFGFSEIPLLRFGNQEVAEDLNARHRFQFFRIHEECVEGEIVKIAEQLH